MLEIEDVTKSFGGLNALSNVNFNISEGEILGVIGPNGAGKTTLLDVMTGRYRPDKGKVIFKDKDITGLKTHKVVRQGISRSFQIEVLFNNLTVLRNVIISRHSHTNTGFLESVFRTPGYRKKEKCQEEKAMELLDFTGLAAYRDKPACELSHGYQRSLGIAVALGTKPDLLLLDEPLSALSPERVEDILSLILEIRGRGSTVLIIEHNMGALFRICDRIIVLNVGKKIAEGTPDEIKNNEDVIKAYLGGDSHA